MFIFFGDVSAFDEFIKCYFGAKAENPPLPCNAVVYDKKEKKLYDVGVYNDSGLIYKSEIQRHNPEAFGSGSKHAITAMDMGASAKEAVGMAVKRDSGTGGKIRTTALNYL